MGRASRRLVTRVSRISGTSEKMRDERKTDEMNSSEWLDSCNLDFVPS